MSDEFATPSAPGGDPLDLHALQGSLLIVEATEWIESMQTSMGETTALRANVSVVDGPHQGMVREDALLFGRVLKGQLRGNVGGKKVLGRLNRGVAKPGQSAPWILDPATPQDMAAASEWQRRQASSQFSQPGGREQQPAAFAGQGQTSQPPF